MSGDQGQQQATWNPEQNDYDVESSNYEQSGANQGAPGTWNQDYEDPNMFQDPQGLTFDLGSMALPDLLNQINPVLMDDMKNEAPEVLNALLKQEVNPFIYHSDPQYFSMQPESTPPQHHPSHPPQQHSHSQHYSHPPGRINPEYDQYHHHPQVQQSHPLQHHGRPMQDYSGQSQQPPPYYPPQQTYNTQPNNNYYQHMPNQHLQGSGMNVPQQNPQPRYKEAPQNYYDIPKGNLVPDRVEPTDLSKGKRQTVQSTQPPSTVAAQKRSQAPSLGANSANTSMRQSAVKRTAEAESESNNDESDSKKLMRAERNRQSAAASRERKKHHIRELERRVSMLSAENAQLQIEQLQSIRSRIEKERELVQENQKLKQKVVFQDMQIGKLTKQLEQAGFSEEKLKRPSTWSSGEWGAKKK